MNLTNHESDLSVGVNILDRDHREMSKTISDLRTVLSTGELRSSAASLLLKLAHFSLVHFGLEEGIMAATGYPRLRAHCRRHQGMKRELTSIAARYNQAGAVPNDKSLAFLDELHNEHVLEEDLTFGIWLNETDYRDVGVDRGHRIL